MGELGMLFVGAAIGFAAWSLHPGRKTLRALHMALAGAAGALAAGLAEQVTLFARDGSMSSIALVLGGALAAATAYSLVRPLLKR
ncbi:MAG: GlsB/YeaQ/YmgE family stress response membrane protein [Candidatus Protistobacter heckmanni]|nr:GlsB/YeaQ/YmgE family stress response membrane protein [Candidatus Protistobacter heckmanni]